MDISQIKSQGVRSVKRRIHTAKTAIHMDFTPMVDLGFLLITFFMLTTSLQEKRVMQLFMPVKDLGQTEPIAASKTLTLLLSGHDKIYFYRGLSENGIDSCGYDNDGLRKVILQAKNEVETRFGLIDSPDRGPKSPLVVLIKPTENSVFKNIVDVLDEMHITGISKYAIVDVAPEDRPIFHHLK